MSLVILFVLCLAVSASSQGSNWKTLDGSPPLVIAHGGFSGIFPDSSDLAYEYALKYSLPNMITWCNLHLSRDGVGVCLPELNLENNTNVGTVFPGRKATYNVNKGSVNGWFASDFAFEEELLSLTLVQGVYSRTPVFDNKHRIQRVEQASNNNARQLWLNIPYAEFYKQRGLDMTQYIKDIINRVNVKYVSSPEAEFLSSLRGSLSSTNTKLVYQLPENDDGTYFNNHLSNIKQFAQGILVPKSSILPVDANSYLLPHTSLVSDAHNASVQVFVSGFANDVPYAYNFNYDPVTENLAFIDNGEFCVDGIVSDFPLTSSAAIDCFSGMGNNEPSQKNVLVISNEGASGVYPGCTDLAYKTAIGSGADGADVIDCPVQMTQDGTPICLGSVNLLKRTNVAQSRFGSSARNISELGGIGIFTFDFTLKNLHDLQPEILSPDPAYHLSRNPASKNAGKFLSLLNLLTQVADYNQFTPNPVSGLYLTIENADFLSARGLDIIGKTADIIRNFRTKIPEVNKIMIRSSEKSTLLKIKQQYPEFERVYIVNDDVDLGDFYVINDIQSFADSVEISKDIAYAQKNKFLTNDSSIIPQLKKKNLKVYLRGIHNEFVYQSWDFLSDAYAELNTFVEDGADGVITDFPRTGAIYKRNRCLAMSNRPPYMTRIKGGELFQRATMSKTSATQSSPAKKKNRRLGEHKKAYSKVHA